MSVESLAHLKSAGIGAIAGALVGVLAVFWIKPTTEGGIALVIFLCALLGCLVGELGKLLFGKKR